MLPSTILIRYVCVSSDCSWKSQKPISSLSKFNILSKDSNVDSDSTPIPSDTPKASLKSFVLINIFRKIPRSALSASVCALNALKLLDSFTNEARFWILSSSPKSFTKFLSTPSFIKSFFDIGNNLPGKIYFDILTVSKYSSSLIKVGLKPIIFSFLLSNSISTERICDLIISLPPMTVSNFDSILSSNHPHLIQTFLGTKPAPFSIINEFLLKMYPLSKRLEVFDSGRSSLYFFLLESLFKTWSTQKESISATTFFRVTSDSFLSVLSLSNFFLRSSADSPFLAPILTVIFVEPFAGVTFLIKSVPTLVMVVVQSNPPSDLVVNSKFFTIPTTISISPLALFITPRWFS